jgi:hypothetical protein
VSSDVKVYPMPRDCEWWDRMWDTFNGWCKAKEPPPPDGFDRSWGCYRRPGHTGRHLGIVSRGTEPDSDAWVVWPS